MNKRMQDEFNKQINEELFSSYLYLSMANYLEDASLPGFASWMRVQAEEEKFHAEKFMNHLNERGGRVKLLAIEEPKFEWKDIVEIFDDALNHEKHITSRIHHMMDVALEEKDYAAKNLLDWFVDEQVEEEDTAAGILDQLKWIDGKGNGLLMMDRELGQRVFTPEADAE